MSLKHTIAACVLMLSTSVFLNFIHKTEDVNLKKPLASFPRQIGEWTGKEERFSDDIYLKLGVDDSFLATYRTLDGRLINLYIGFYQSQREGEIIHSPKNCLPGAGWNFSQISVEEVPVDKGTIRVNQVVVQNGSEKQIMLYWYQSRGRIITSEYLQKVYLVLDSITRRRTDGSFIRIMAPVLENDIELSKRNIRSFTSIIFPTLQEFIPS
jgi:EpsI family protein